MLRLPGSLPIGGRLTVEPGPDPVPPPLELPHPASRAAPPRDAAPARNVRRSSLFVIDPPIRRSGPEGSPCAVISHRVPPPFGVGGRGSPSARITDAATPRMWSVIACPAASP